MRRPTESDIEALLEAFQPGVSERFHQKMAGMPWNTLTDEETITVNGRQTIRARRWVLAATVMLALMAGLAASPPVRAFAGEMLRFFTRAETDSFSLEAEVVDVSVVDEWVGEDGQSEVRAVGPDDFLVDSLEEASARAGFEARTPAYLPDGYQLEQIFALEGQPFASLNYRSADPHLGLSILQRPADLAAGGVFHFMAEAYVSDEGEGEAEPPEHDVHARAVAITVEGEGEPPALGDVGASAEVVTVSIGDVEGEYVAGSWGPDAAPALAEDLEPGMTVEIENTWDPDAPVQRLRWEADGISFEIMAFGDDLTLDDLVAIAESM